MKKENQFHEDRHGFAKWAIDHPHLIVVSCIIITILGLISVISLPKDLLPAAEMPAVQILSFYPGMPVERVEKNLTARYERYTGQAVGIQKQESKSLVGVSIVKNYFGPGTDLNTAIAQTTSLVMSVLRRLPPGTQPPLILPFDPTASVPLGLVAVSGDFKEKELYDTARYDVGNSVQSVTGAMAPTVMGGSERQVVVYLDPQKLKTFNFSPVDVLDRLARLNTFIPSGDVKIGNLDYQILSNGLVDRIGDMNDFPLRSHNGVPVYLKDVGEARDSHKIQTNIVRIDGKRQVYVPVYRQPGANSIRVVDEVKEAIKNLETTLQGYKLTWVSDQSIFIRHAISSITEEALIGGGLAALMVFLFLGNPRSTVGILLSLPLSLLCAFLGLKASGQTINAMTLGGLALSIGVLVDNSIVVLENISKKIEEGSSVFEAALQGTSEVAMPVLSSTLCTLIVLFPVVFLSGIVKVLFSALAKSVMFAMIGSFLTAMIVIPLFASYYLKGKNSGSSRRKILQLTSELMNQMTNSYGLLLMKALNARRLVLLSTGFFLFLGSLLIPFIGTELFPRADAGNFVLELRQPSGVRIEETEKFAQIMESNLKKWIPAEDLKMIITNAGVYYGFPAAFTPNSGPQDIFFNIELSEDRKQTSQYYAKVLREHLKEEYPNIDVGIELGGLLTSALNGGLRSPIDLQVEGPDVVQSHHIAESILPLLTELHGAVDVRIQQRFDAPQISLDVDRKKAMELGLTTDEVVKNIVSAVSGSTSFNPAVWVDPKTGIDYLLGVQFLETSISNVDELSTIPMTGRNQERSIPLRRIANVSHVQGPSEINHVNLKPIIDIFMDAQGRDIGGLSKDVQKIIEKTQLPKGYSIHIQGEISEMSKSVGALGGGFLLAAILVYLILVVQFKSFSLPLVIMAAVPMGLVGIIIMLALTHTYFSIQAAIGAIFMIGIAVANGVLLVEFISHHRENYSSLHEAVVQGAKVRLRPILMTSLASILGLVPMAVGFGHGSEANIPLGRAVIGGQLLSMTLTLFIVPILYFLLTNRKPAQAFDNTEKLEQREPA